ncbi:MAG: DHA2 family efflux MFS transporter permease subunit [Eggerthellaceae bacterium]|nr:DHA2 family efflux MFS transporter permease subunit [Eggerthellaceae bacterium]
MPSLLKNDTTKVYVLYAILVLLATFGNMSQTALNAMLPDIVSDFGINMSVGQWLTTIFMMGFGIMVPLVTFLTKRFSMKNLMYLSSGLSLLGLVFAMTSMNFTGLLIGRILQSFATGMFIPLMQTTAMVRFPANRRATAMGIAGIAMGTSPSLGPTLGGLMDFNFGWRSFFVALAVIAVVLLVVTVLLVEPGKAPDKTAKLDSFSFALSSLGFGLLLFSFSNASNYALQDPLVWAPLIVGAFCVVWFMRRQRRVASPLVDLRIFKVQKYTVGFIALNLMFIAHMASMLLVPLYVQDVCGGSSLEAGLTLLPGIFGSVLVSPLAGYLMDRIGVRPIALLGGLCFAAGACLMVVVNAQTSLMMTTVFQTVRALGVSLLVGPLTTFSLGTLPREQVTDGSSFILMVRQTLSALGTSLSVFILTATLAMHADPMLGYQLAFALCAVFAVSCLVTILIRVK